jgi:hypothetical protein
VGHVNRPCLSTATYVFCQEPMYAFIDVCCQVALFVNADVFWHVCQQLCFLSMDPLILLFSFKRPCLLIFIFSGF